MCGHLILNEWFEFININTETFLLIDVKNNS